MSESRIPLNNPIAPDPNAIPPSDGPENPPDEPQRSGGLLKAISDYRDSRKKHRENVQNTLAYIHHQTFYTTPFKDEQGIRIAKPPDATIASKEHRQAVRNVRSSVLHGEILPSDAKQKILEINAKPADLAEPGIRAMKIRKHIAPLIEEGLQRPVADLPPSRFNETTAQLVPAMPKIRTRRSERKDANTAPVVPVVDPIYAHYFDEEWLRTLDAEISENIRSQVRQECDDRNIDRLPDAEFKALTAAERERTVRNHVAPGTPHEIIEAINQARAQLIHPKIKKNKIV